MIDISRHLIQEILIIQKISEILEHTFTVSPETIDTSKIPANLLDLIPILSEWAISDDVEREEKIRMSFLLCLKFTGID